MLRDGEWQSCAVPLIWTEFTADIMEHRVREVTSGERFAVTLFTPSHLERLSERDWMNLESHGFPVHLYAERARTGLRSEEVTDADLGVEFVTGVHEVEESATKGVFNDPTYEAHHAEQAGTPEEALTQLAGQIPQPYPAQSSTPEPSLRDSALLPRVQARDGSPGRGIDEGRHC